MAFLQCEYHSDVLGRACTMNVLVPQKAATQIGMTSSAASGRAEYPVLFLLHGLSDNHTIWMRRTSIERYAAAYGLVVVMLYVSADNGEHWTKIFQDKAFGYLTRVAVHPSDPNTVYLSAFSTRPFHDSDGGIRKSTDGGKSWKTVFPGKACWGVYLHPTHPDTVFAATYDKGVFRSTDGGATWEELEDYPAPSPISITFDPENPDILYVCNFGGSVYRGAMK